MMSSTLIINTKTTHGKRGLTTFSMSLRKSQSKNVMQNFMISPVGGFVFEPYGTMHALPCFVEVFNGMLKFQAFFYDVLKRDWMKDCKTMAG